MSDQCLIPYRTHTFKLTHTHRDRVTTRYLHARKRDVSGVCAVLPCHLDYESAGDKNDNGMDIRDGDRV
jgi:hypothetical protein